ncbi:MAG: DNA polymerase III subunit delta [Cyanobacteria bacterium RUI128]|nr:DNA polymerase III subunit delta [Cyanobacteria bacterium RUI128]
MSVYFFYGDEDYLIDKELEKYRAKLDKNFSEMNYTVYDKLEYPDLVSVLRTQPMMFGKMMIVINTHKLFKSGNKRESLLSASLDDKQISEISAALEDNSEMLDIFFVEKYDRDDKKKAPDSRRKIFKTLSKFNTQTFPSIQKYKTAELISWITKIAKDKKLKINHDAAEALIMAKGNNLREYDTELSKLSLLAHPENIITKQMVNEICTSNEDLFNLTDFIIDNDYGKAMIELRQLLETRHPLEVLVPLQTMLKQWIYMKLHCKTMSHKEIGDKLGRMHEYRVKVTLDKLRNTKLKTLVDLKTRITEAEYKIKTGQVFSPQEELENAIIG